MIDKDKLILHPKTRQQLSGFIKNPIHSLIISGDSYSGKKTLAYHIIGSLLEINEIKKITADKLLWQKPINKQLTIDQVRLAKNFAKVKQNDTSPRRFIVFEDAGSMAEPAQNALLKVLEEPPAGVIIILLVQNELSLRPTIRSRARSLRILKPDIQTVKSYLDHSEIDKLYSISEGRIGLLTKLINQKGEETSLGEAKSYLTMTILDRLIKNSSMDDRATAIKLISDIQIIARAGMMGSINNNQIESAKSWLTRYKNCMRCQQYIKENANIKLSLDWLAVKLV